MAIPSVASFVEAVRQCRLLEPAQLAVVVSDLQPRFSDARALAKQLVERGWLTEFQVNVLLQNNGKELLLEPYVILDRIGEGGTGKVFKARHLHMQRTVALKVIRKELLTDGDVVQRFYREIEAASQVSHSNVVHAYDAGPIGPMHVLVMEHVEGIDLGRLVKESGPMPIGQACECIRQAALGLQHIHECGLVHRDIKPSNLFLARVQGSASRAPSSKPADAETRARNTGVAKDSGLIKILDLGLARLLPRERRVTGDPLTDVGSVTMGTPDYLAPEQALDMHAADIRADIYSLGCTLYFLLTGQPPFAGGTLAQKLMRHQQAEPPALAKLRSDAPAALQPILARMLAKRREDRYQTPAAVARALAELRLPADPDTARFRRTRRRRWLIAAVGPALILLVGLIALGIALAASRSRVTTPGAQLVGGAGTARDAKGRAAATAGAIPTSPGRPVDATLTHVLQGRAVVRDVLLDWQQPDRKIGTEPKHNALKRTDQCDAFLVRFDLATVDLRKQARVEKAVFSFYVWDPHSNAVSKVCAFAVKTPWEEASATWNQPADGKRWANGKSFSFDADTGPPSRHVVVKPDEPGTDTVDPPLEYQLDVTAIVQSWLDGSQPNHGLALAPVIDRAIDDGSLSRFQIYASEHPRPQFTPKLVIHLKP